MNDKDNNSRPDAIFVSKVSFSYQELFDEGETTNEVSVVCELSGIIVFCEVRSTFEVTLACLDDEFDVLSYESSVPLGMLWEYLEEFVTLKVPTPSDMGHANKVVGLDTRWLGGPTAADNGGSAGYFGKGRGNRSLLNAAHVCQPGVTVRDINAVGTGPKNNTSKQWREGFYSSEYLASRAAKDPKTE